MVKQSINSVKKKAAGNKSYFLFCLFIAVTAWFVMKMSKNYQVTYTYQVCLKNVPKEKVAIYQSDSAITVNMENKGVSLLSADLRSKKIQFDYDDFFTDYQKQRKTVHVQNKQIVEYLKADRRFANNLTGVNVNAISFRFEDLAQED